LQLFCESVAGLRQKTSFRSALPVRRDYKVLAVDDEPIVHSMVAAIIEGCDLPVYLAGTALSGEETLESARLLQPDICLLDINMSGMNGLELGRRISELLEYKPKIIYISAYERFEYAQEAIRVGAIEYILKPIRRQELVKALGKAVNSLQAERIARLEHQALKEHAESIGASAEVPSESRDAAIAKSMRRYIDEHYSDDISISDAAAHMQLSPGYAGALFKSVVGIPFRSYLRIIRISRAKELMQDHTLNLTQIAESVGYKDVNYFSQAFLAETGVRPGEYRGSGRRWAK
jgi:YesN/AraC family two-component response regulator